MRTNRIPYTSPTERDSDWRLSAACAQTDLEIFFPAGGGSIETPKAVCRRCPVIEDCHKFIVAVEASITENHWSGIYAGMTAVDRKRVAKARRAERDSSGNKAP